MNAKCVAACGSSSVPLSGNGVERDVDGVEDAVEIDAGADLGADSTDLLGTTIGARPLWRGVSFETEVEGRSAVQ